MVRSIETNNMAGAPEIPDSSSGNNPISNLSSKLQKLSDILKKVERGELKKNDALLRQIEDVKETADSAIKSLETLNDELQERASDDLFPEIRQVINPAISRTSKIINTFEQSLINKNPLNIESDYILEQINELNEIYSEWTDLKSIENSVLQTIVNKISKTVLETKNQINNYKSHRLAEAPEEIDDSVHDKINSTLDTSFQKFDQSLRDLNVNWNIEAAGKAVQTIKGIRESIFDSSFEMIDKLVPIHLSPSSVEVEPPLIELEINFVKKEIKALKEHVGSFDKSDEKSLNDFKAYIDSIKLQLEQLLEQAPREKDVLDILGLELESIEKQFFM